MTVTEKTNRAVAWFLIPWIITGFSATIYLGITGQTDLMAAPLLFNFFGVFLTAGFILYQLATESGEK